jgi:hypothetical protein
MPIAGNKRLGARMSQPYILAQSAVPVCLAPNGTVATNGIVTLGTALPVTYSGGIWLRLPAGAVVDGLAGLYWAVMSNGTTGQVYTNYVDPANAFTPYVPSGTLAAATGSNAAYTQATGADVTLVNVTLPAGAMGNNGGMYVNYSTSNNNSAGAKVSRIKAGATTLGTFSLSATTTTGAVTSGFVRNRGVQTSQIGHTTSVSSNNPPVFTAIDFSASVALSLTGQLAVATDYLVLETFYHEVLPG